MSATWQIAALLICDGLENGLSTQNLLKSMGIIMDKGHLPQHLHLRQGIGPSAPAFGET